VIVVAVVVDHDNQTGMREARQRTTDAGGVE